MTPIEVAVPYPPEDEVPQPVVPDMPWIVELKGKPVEIRVAVENASVYRGILAGVEKSLEHRIYLVIADGGSFDYVNVDYIVTIKEYKK